MSDFDIRTTPRIEGHFAWDEEENSFFGWYHPEERWNGFAVPAFDLIEGIRLLLWQNAQPGAGTPDNYSLLAYDRVNDCFIIDDRNVYPEQTWEDLDRCSGFDSLCRVAGESEPALKHLYAIGGYNWTWSEVDG